MVVNVEFLGEEPIENIITCMHYKVDKVIYFGYQDAIDMHKYKLPDYLKKYCGVEEVAFYTLKREDMQSILSDMRDRIMCEKRIGNSVYFDITGGDSLVLVSFGMLSKEFDTPMHMYDIVGDKLIEIEDGSLHTISQEVEGQEVKFDIDKYIELMGGTVNYNMHKAIKGDDSPDFAEDIEKIWEVASKYRDFWNGFSMFLKSEPHAEKKSKDGKKIVNISQTVHTSKKGFVQNNSEEIIKDLESSGIICDLQYDNNIYRFNYKSQAIKSCIWEGGSALELHTYFKVKNDCDDCRVGVHIDWDGIVNTSGFDVLNEIDVLAIKGNVPIFISCKSGKMESPQSLHALYELQTVCKRFGGKYARKALVSMQAIGPFQQERAKEMGIEVW